MLGLELAQLDLQLGALAGRVVERASRVGQLGLVECLEAGELAAAHLLTLRHLQLQRAVLRLQAAHLVDVHGQPVVELAQLLLLLQPRQPRGAQWRGGAAGAAARPLLHGGRCRHGDRRGELSAEAAGSAGTRRGRQAEKREGRHEPTIRARGEADVGGKDEAPGMAGEGLQAQRAKGEDYESIKRKTSFVRKHAHTHTRAHTRSGNTG